MKKTLLTFMALSLISISAYAQNAEAQGNVNPQMQQRLEAANSYQDAVPVDLMLEGIAKEFMTQPNFRLNPEMVNRILASYDLNSLREKSTGLLAYHFTFDEIMAMRDFYSSPEGQAIYAKMPGYLTDLAPILQSETKKAIGSAMQNSLQNRQSVK